MLPSNILRNVVLLFSGYNDRAIITFCRFFSSNNIPFFIISLSENDQINLTDYRDDVIYQRSDKKLNISDFLYYRSLIEKKISFEHIVILPTSEFLNRFLINNLEFLSANQFVVPLVDLNVYAEISDKLSFGRLCESNKINIPKNIEKINHNVLPFVAKPKAYFVNGSLVNEKPILIMTEKDFDNLLNLKSIDNFYFQEFVGGDSFYFLFYFDKNGDYNVYSQQNIAQQANGLSIIAAKSCDIHLDDEVLKYSNLLKQKRFRGFIMIEVKYFNNKFYMIEANPRIWGPSQLILDSNMNLIHQFAIDYNLADNSILNDLGQYKPNIEYFWNGGLLKDNKNGLTTVFHNSDKSILFNYYEHWLSNDIYNRPDTVKIFELYDRL